MATKQVQLDSIWRELGSSGKFQIFQASIFVFHEFIAGFTILAAVFTGYVPEYTCRELPPNQISANSGVVHNLTYEYNITYKYEKCEIQSFKTMQNSTELQQTDTCINGYEYPVPSDSTYTAEWNLVCSKSTLPTLAQSFVMVGQGIGSFFLSHVCDIFGRKPVLVFSTIGILVTSSVIALSPSIIMVMILRVVAGMLQQGLQSSGSALRLEIFPREMRSAINAIAGLFWAASMMLLSLIAYIFEDLNWRHLQLALASFSLVGLAEWWMVEESVRWLLVNGRIEQAKTVLQKVARWNGVAYAKIEVILNEVLKQSSEDNTSVKELSNVTERDQSDASSKTIHAKKPIENVPCDNSLYDRSNIDNGNNANKNIVRNSMIEILKDSKLRRNTFILWYAWLTVAATYYGLTLISVKFAGNRFLNFFLSALFEIPSQFIMWYLCDRIGRKKTIVAGYAVTAFALITATGLLSELEHIKAFSITATVFALIGKMAISGTFGAVILYTPEIYPTNYRSRGPGIASALSRIGAVLAPFSSNLADIALWIPAAIFGGMCLLVSIIAIKLPESKYFELPQSMKELKNWKREGKQVTTNSMDNKALQTHF